MTKRFRIVLFVLAVGCIVVSPSFADGIVVPLKVYKKLPAIPQQRAVVVYRDGTEKLLIESSVSGPGKKLAWIVPVPSEPNAFEEASRTVVDALSEALQTEIIDFDRYGKGLISIGAAFFVLIWGLVMIRYDHSPLRVTGAVIFLVFPIAFVAFLFVPLSYSKYHAYEEGTKGMDEMPRVEVEQSVTVGSYELTVLQAVDADALQTWLGDNGYMELPEEADAIVNDYIDEDWHFVAAKLRRDTEGFSRPHPIVMTFPAPAPVYPMRLTQLAGNDLYLQLFVIAEGGAAAESLTLEHADTYEASAVDTSTRVYSGKKWGVDFDLADLVDVMWDECTVTKLSGTLTPAAMDQDVQLQLSKATPYRERLYTRRGARTMAYMYGAGIWGVALPFLLLVYLARRKSTENESPRRLNAMVPTAVVGVLAVPVALAILFAVMFAVVMLAFAVPFAVFILAWMMSFWAAYHVYTTNMTEVREKRERTRATCVILLPVLAASILFATGIYAALPKTETYLAPESNHKRAAPLHRPEESAVPSVMPSRDERNGSGNVE